MQLEEELERMTAVLQDSADKMPITSNMIAKATQHDEMLNRIIEYILGLTR